MRIALDATYSVDPTPSGVAVYSRELMNGLALSHPEDEFLRCYRWKQWRGSKLHGRLLLPPFRTFKADLFHALNQRVDSRPARRVVSTFHDLFVMTAEYSSPEFRRRFADQARRAATNSDAIIAVSHFTASQVESLFGIPGERIRVVPHGGHKPSLARTPSARPFVLSVGTMQRRKNTARLIEAFASLSREWQLVLAGSASGYGCEEALHAISNSPASDRIKVTGYITPEALARLYASATIFAFPSLDEGFGIPVLEAMAYGVPVITSNRSGLVEAAGDAALLVDPTRKDEIASALLRLADNEALRAELSVRGLKHAAGFTWERAASETYGVYRELRADG